MTNHPTTPINLAPLDQEDFHCITCSDQALPARVLSIDPTNTLAQVQLGSTTEEIDISLVDKLSPGDMVLVHGGVALEIMRKT